MVETQDVSEWSQTFHKIDVPNIMLSFSGIISHILMLEYGYNTTVEIAVPLMSNIQAVKIRVIVFKNFCIFRFVWGWWGI